MLMKKLLLTLVAVIATTVSAFADANIVFEQWNLKAADITSLEAGDFTFTFAKNSGATAPTYNGTGKDIRVFAKGTVKIAAKENMTKITFNLSAQGLKRLAPITASTGTITTQKAGDKIVEWTGSAKEVTFTVGDKAEYGSDGATKAGQFDFLSVDIVGGGTATASTDPVINCADVVEFTNVKQGDASFTKTINVSLLNIEGKFTAELKGSSVFEIDETSTKTDYQTKIGIKLADTSKAGEYTATLTISAGGLTKNVTLKVNIEAVSGEVSTITVAEALEIINALTDGATTSEQYIVSGKVESVEISTQYGNATLVLEGGLTVFRAYDFDSKKFTDANKIKVGDNVKFKGKLQKYVKDGTVTPELATGGCLVELNGVTAINSVNQEISKSATAYNIAGQKVSENYKGIVIRGGKKYMK